MRLDGKVAILARAESETTRALARRFVAEGAKVVACAASLQGTDQTRVAIGDSGLVVEADPRLPADAQRVVQTALDRFGRVDVLVNSGNSRRIIGTILELTEAEFDEEMGMDLKAGINLARYAVPAMVQTGGGSIINLSSVAAPGVKGRVLRSLSKAAINSLTVAMALDHGPSGVRVNGLLLGPALTEQVKRDPANFARMVEETPLKRLHTDDDTAAAAVFLASDESAAMTGALIPLDAGRWLPRH